MKNFNTRKRPRNRFSGIEYSFIKNILYLTVENQNTKWIQEKDLIHFIALEESTTIRSKYNFITRSDDTIAHIYYFVVLCGIFRLNTELDIPLLHQYLFIIYNTPYWQAPNSAKQMSIVLASLCFLDSNTECFKNLLIVQIFVEC